MKPRYRYTSLILVALILTVGFVLLCSQTGYGETLQDKLLGTGGGFIPIEGWITTAVDWMAINFRPLFDVVTIIVNVVNDTIITILRFGDWHYSGVFVFNIFGTVVQIPLLAGLVGLLMWYLSGSIVTGSAGLVMLWLAANFGYWPETIETFSLTLTSAFLALVLGIPTGIFAAINDTADTIIRPILDLMQTMPVFVYLIPAVLFFGIGPAPGAVATVIFAYPPAVRLTNLGIRGVPTELIEAGESFGCNNIQLLTKVQLPVARPNIMAGVNQTIMLALSMAVVAGLVGAGGLGGVVVRGIQRMRVGEGFVGGLVVVFVAMILDRATSNIGQSTTEEA
ncbi:ABC transporter permease subunit [Candidatus Bipolaricaulota bacterium]|nr:ABC transporter permease subunit [Candidatus Bipolaricaulota bacterium]